MALIILQWYTTSDGSVILNPVKAAGSPIGRLSWIWVGGIAGLSWSLQDGMDSMAVDR